MLCRAARARVPVSDNSGQPRLEKQRRSDITMSLSHAWAAAKRRIAKHATARHSPCRTRIGRRNQSPPAHSGRLVFPLKRPLIMPRPVTLFTGQWADLPLGKLAPMVKKMGYDG